MGDLAMIFRLAEKLADNFHALLENVAVRIVQ